MALALSVTRVFVPRDDWERALWKHALQVAIAARRLTQFSADNTVLADQAYACGLLHDVGRFVMFLEAPEALKRVDQSEWEGGEGLLAAELEICGLTHAELGALACERWGLPELLVRMVREHHTVGLIVPADHAGKLTAIVRLADRAMFSSALPGSPGLERVTDKEIEKSFLTVRPGFLDIGPKELRGVALATASEANLVANSLGL
jgi:putative nucleotidyltransferase with HDIG domain